MNNDIRELTVDEHDDVSGGLLGTYFAGQLTAIAIFAVEQGVTMVKQVVKAL